MSDSIAQLMTHDHRRCDQLLAVCEQDFSRSNWAGLAESGPAFSAALLGHFDLEEEVLFPELIDANPVAMGPTRVMTMEHQQMRALLDELRLAIEARDRASGLGVIETLHLLVQQHNMKEEGILYPMADVSLGDSNGILDRLTVV
ncbi:MAG: hemerythrin domain-containing protein [Sphingobacteriia bacterium]|nr:hemerythrin domain-containing protein [Sphingobacteriia bacterium]NCC41735.1 hemerythrin domain-containing protein [Gammaproteobacteria bacterium]